MRCSQTKSTRELSYVFPPGQSIQKAVFFSDLKCHFGWERDAEKHNRMLCFLRNTNERVDEAWDTVPNRDTTLISPTNSYDGRGAPMETPRVSSVRAAAPEVGPPIKSHLNVLL